MYKRIIIISLILITIGGIILAIKETVKGHCGDSKCTYDVYTKEKSDELLDGVYTKEKVDELLNKLEEALIGKKLKGNIDLNNITEEGIYVISDEVTSVSNAPRHESVHTINGGEKLEVYKNASNQLTQKFIYRAIYGNYEEVKYERKYTNGAWGDWATPISNEVVLAGSLTVPGAESTGGYNSATKEIAYPPGFTKGTTYVVALGVETQNRKGWVYGSESPAVSYDALLGSGRHNVVLDSNKIIIRLENRSTSSVTFDFELVLKISPPVTRLV